MTVHFTVNMAAVGKARPRFGKGKAYNPAKTKQAELIVASAARRAMAGKDPMTSPVQMTIIAQYLPPPSWPKWQREHAIDHQAMKGTKPDLDNIQKLIADACNGVLYLDDQQIARCSVVKRYGREDKIVVTVDELDPLPLLKADL